MQMQAEHLLLYMPGMPAGLGAILCSEVTAVSYSSLIGHNVSDTIITVGGYDLSLPASCAYLKRR